jgi:hypothetical protein
LPSVYQQPALPEAVLLFAIGLAAVSTTRGGSSFFRRLYSSQHYLWHFFFLPSALADG